jgi:hypothetical protein
MWRAREVPWVALHLICAGYLTTCLSFKEVLRYNAISICFACLQTVRNYNVVAAAHQL